MSLSHTVAFLQLLIKHCLWLPGAVRWRQWRSVLYATLLVLDRCLMLWCLLLFLIFSLQKKSFLNPMQPFSKYFFMPGHIILWNYAKCLYGELMYMNLYMYRFKNALDSLTCRPFFFWESNSGIHLLTPYTYLGGLYECYEQCQCLLLLSQRTSLIVIRRSPLITLIWRHQRSVKYFLVASVSVVFY